MMLNSYDLGCESFLPKDISDIIKKSQDFRMQDISDMKKSHEDAIEINEGAMNDKAKCLPYLIYEGEWYESSI